MKTNQNARLRDQRSLAKAISTNKSNSRIHFFSKWKISFVCLLLLSLQITSPCTAQIESSSLRFDTTIVNNYSDCAFIIELNDTTIQSFEVGLRTARDTVDIFLHEILYDQSTGLPQDFTYQRNGQVITLIIGNRERLGYYYGQVRTKNSLGVWSEPYRFLQN